MRRDPQTMKTNRAEAFMRSAAFPVSCLSLVGLVVLFTYLRDVAYLLQANPYEDFVMVEDECTISGLTLACRNCHDDWRYTFAYETNRSHGADGVAETPRDVKLVSTRGRTISFVRAEDGIQIFENDDLKLALSSAADSLEVDADPTVCAVAARTASGKLWWMSFEQSQCPHQLQTLQGLAASLGTTARFLAEHGNASSTKEIGSRVPCWRPSNASLLDNGAKRSMFGCTNGLCYKLESPKIAIDKYGRELLETMEALWAGLILISVLLIASSCPLLACLGARRPHGVAPFTDIESGIRAAGPPAAVSVLQTIVQLEGQDPDAVIVISAADDDCSDSQPAVATATAAR